MNRRKFIALLGGTVVTWALAVFLVGTANASEVKVLASTAIKTALEVLAPQFENAANHKLFIVYGASARLQPEIEKGEAFDLAILSISVTDALIKEGKLVAATRVDIARSGAGVAVRKGTPKPDISTAESFKQVLLNAKSLGYSETGATGQFLMAMFQLPTSGHRAGDEAKTQTRAAKSTEPPGAGRRRDRHWITADQRGSRVPRG
jgi:molybdate transport system substrate-binding protein